MTHLIKSWNAKHNMILMHWENQFNEHSTVESAIKIYVRHYHKSCDQWNWRDFLLEHFWKKLENIFNLIDLATIHSQNAILIALASSGIVVTLLESGRTVHLAYKLPLNIQINETPTYNILQNYAMAKIWSHANCSFWLNVRCA